ncbi:MAG: AarF/ABC1/UbiB kinase family protein [Candidatus Micrarchaeia archaeon]
MNIPGFSQNRRNFSRVTRIAKILVKYGYGDFVAAAKLRTGISIPLFGDASSEKLMALPFPVRMRMMLEELGATYVKLGQILSTREDLVGHDLAAEFSKLLDHVAPMPFHEVEAVIKRELGHAPNTVFAMFEHAPLASASIGQVHRAMLKSGDFVVVKVQRPDVEQAIKDDLAVMKYLASLYGKYGPQQEDQPDFAGIIREFERAIMQEVDYGHEARNAIRFAKNFRDDGTIYAPKVYTEYSTRRVLTMEFVEGTKVSDVVHSRKGFDCKLLAGNGARAFFKQILEDGFFHADPHPGNILVLKNNVLCFLDFGNCGRIDKEFMENITDVFVCVMQYDLNGFVTKLTDMGMMDENVDVSAFKSEMADVMDMCYGEELEDIQMGEVLSALLSLLTRYKIRTPREFVMLSRSLVLMEGTGQMLYPGFNALEVFAPYAKNVARRRYSPQNLVELFKQNSLQIAHFVKVFPTSMRRIMSKLESGKMSIEFEHKNLDVFSSDLERIGNKLVMALVVSALIVGSSLVMLTDKGPKMFDFPVLGLLGFCISGFLGFVLVFSMINHERG